MSNHTDCIITAERAANCANWPEGNSVEVQTYNVQRDTEGGGGRGGWKQNRTKQKNKKKSERAAGIEPATTGFAILCSTTELNAQNIG